MMRMKIKKKLLIICVICLLCMIIGIKTLYNWVQMEIVKDLTNELPHHNLMKTFLRPMEYCNSFHHINSGEEGDSSISGYSLELVHMVMRHGARNSMHSLPGIELPTLSCKVESKFENISRFLDRTRQKWINQKKFGFDSLLYPNKNKCQGSDLTPFGMKQHIMTGRYLQRKYGSLLNITQLHIRSTGYTRTYQSAVAVLLGFLNHTYLPLVRINRSGDASFCSPSLFSGSCHCPGADKLLTKAKKEADQVEREDIDKHMLMNRLRGVLETEISVGVSVFSLIDVLMTFACHAIPLPCSQNQRKCVNQSHLDLIFKIQDRVGKQMVSGNRNYIKYAHLYLHPLLEEMADRMKKVARRKPVESFVLYSGHDITITPLATVLGIHNGKWPPFASRIVIELYKRTENKMHYFIKIFFNGVDVTSKASFCKKKTLKGFCKLKYFLDFVHTHLHDNGLDSYEEGCSSTNL
ncbi:2-phosphoxylose phosphatase 1-like [Mytilus californianus]|uniref:2-phosphoxylose phosphatase 1-like n=1 Tax=Mytilus californianus TaxID=6549 RepID=UPI0022462C37|nr:2-phosphoxylose phosphatase 1-like [Mytilus californianus]